MEGQEPPRSRSATPESPMTSSLYHASSTIDDLTLALTNFSRAPSPGPPSLVACCCGREDCENAMSWLSTKSRLESRLILSAEVGQALLQRHEAYVRRHEGKPRHRGIEPSKEAEDADEDLNSQIEALIREKSTLEKRLNQALVNNEVTEVSNKTILQELQEARTTISRLTAHHAKSVGWDTRLSAAMKEREDMQQERDSESNRARLAESRFAALRDKTTKLQAEVRRLQASLEEKRQHRIESSESLLQDAKVRLEAIQKSQMGLTAMAEQSELRKVMESLVNDNDILQRDNAELQQLLSDSREDLHALQEEVEEQRALFPRSGGNTPHTPSSRHFHTSSVPSIVFPQVFGSGNRTSDADRRRRFEGPLTPETAAGLPLSPTESMGPSGRWSPFGHVSPRPSSHHISYELEDDAEQEIEHSEEKPRAFKPLLLLNRSRGVQTDPWPGMPSPSPLPSHISSLSPPDAQSESSSFSESLSSHISVLLERATALLNRMTQADALTLTNRLKRQHLKGAHVGHLSRSTVGNIIAEAAGLRTQFRALLEDEKVILTCTRKDLRALFKFVKEAFMEMGQLRVTLNDVILDPGSAPRISELALNPAKAETELREKEGGGAGVSGAAGWMAPIQKLFAPVVRHAEPPAGDGRAALTRSVSSAARPPRFIPKLRPALAASATTVNVEFSGTGVGRSVTNTFSAPSTSTAVDIGPNATSRALDAPSSAMSIFAGAPQPATADPWVVVPKGPRRVQSAFLRDSETPTPAATATIGRSTGRSVNRLSRNVDAVIDVAAPIGEGEDEEADQLPPLLDRTLRRRGLSDSSIHSTFTNHGDETSPSKGGDDVSGDTMWSARPSVFQTLSRTVQNLRNGMAPSNTSPSIVATVGTSSVAGSPSGPPSALATGRPQQPQTPRKSSAGLSRTTSPGLSNLLPSINLSSWTANVAESYGGADPFVAGSSVQEESYMDRARRQGESHGRDYY